MKKLKNKPNEVASLTMLLNRKKLRSADRHCPELKQYGNRKNWIEFLITVGTIELI